MFHNVIDFMLFFKAKLSKRLLIAFYQGHVENVGFFSCSAAEKNIYQNLRLKKILNVLLRFFAKNPHMLI